MSSENLAHHTEGTLCSRFEVPRMEMAFTFNPDMLMGDSSTLDQVFLPMLDSAPPGSGEPLSRRREGGDQQAGQTCVDIPSSYSQILSSSEPSARCHQATVVSVVMVVLVLLLVVVGHQHVRLVLGWLEAADPLVACAIFTLLFTLVSLPLAWGCMLLMVTAGYLYSFLYGPLVVLGCGGVGLLAAHTILRRCCRGCFMQHFYSRRVRTVLMLLESHHAFKIIALARLTPIPFGLQNGLFALADTPLLVYLGASLVGLLPMAMLNCYMGSTLRTMEDVLSDDNSQFTGLLIFGGQILVTVGLLLFAVRKARMELRRTVETLSDEGVGTPSSKDLVEVTAGGGC